MQLMIDIPKDAYDYVMGCGYFPTNFNMIYEIRNGIVLPDNHGKLKDVDKIIEKLQNHRDLFISAYNGDFSNMPKDYKARVDEIINCISVIINATTTLEAWGNEE